ncbi:hypothetical protein ABZP36_004957 [Zizania latifolia]
MWYYWRLPVKRGLLWKKIWCRGRTGSKMRSLTMQATLCCLNPMIHIVIVIPSSSIDSDDSGIPSSDSGGSSDDPGSSGPSDSILTAAAPPTIPGSGGPFDDVLAAATALRRPLAAAAPPMAP